MGFLARRDGDGRVLRIVIDGDLHDPTSGARKDIMFDLNVIGHFLLRAGSLQASPIAPGVRDA
jgi:hypothetical protein